MVTFSIGQIVERMIYFAAGLRHRLNRLILVRPSVRMRHCAVEARFEQLVVSMKEESLPTPDTEEAADEMTTLDLCLKCGRGLTASEQIMARHLFDAGVPDEDLLLLFGTHMLKVGENGSLRIAVPTWQVFVLATWASIYLSAQALVICLTAAELSADSLPWQLGGTVVALTPIFVCVYLLDTLLLQPCLAYRRRIDPWHHIARRRPG